MSETGTRGRRDPPATLPNELATAPSPMTVDPKGIIPGAGRDDLSKRCRRRIRDWQVVPPRLTGRKRLWQRARTSDASQQADV